MSRADSEFITGTPVELPAAERERIAAEIEEHLSAADALILRMDGAEPDPDLEDNADGEPDNDNEPSLGWTGDLNQERARKACLGGGEDLEDEHDGREPCCEDEGAQCEGEGADADVLECEPRALYR